MSGSEILALAPGTHRQQQGGVRTTGFEEDDLLPSLFVGMIIVTGFGVISFVFAASAGPQPAGELRVNHHDTVPFGYEDRGVRS